MTYQRNMSKPLLPQEDVLDEALEDEVGAVEEDADDQARDQDDRDALDQLRLLRPLDLLQLSPGFRDEAPEAAARQLALGAPIAGGEADACGAWHPGLGA